MTTGCQLNGSGDSHPVLIINNQPVNMVGCDNIIQDSQPIFALCFEQPLNPSIEFTSTSPALINFVSISLASNAYQLRKTKTIMVLMIWNLCPCFSAYLI